MNGTVNESEFGKLVLYAIPTKEAEEMVVAFLSRRVKNVPAEKLAQKIKMTPFVLSKNIAVKNGVKIAQNLRDLGAKAGFVPHNPGPQGPEPLSPTTVTPEFESIHPVFEQNKSQQLSRPGSSRFGKRLITASVVVILISVLSLLTWQLYHLLAEKFF